MTGQKTDLDDAVERAVREWFSHMTGAGAVTPDVVEFTRERFRRFYQNREAQDSLRISSLNEAIAEACRRCSTWRPDDFLYFCWWVKCSFDWAKDGRGWQAHLLDAIADDLPAETLSPAAFHAWKSVENPQEFLLTSRWRQIFNRGGYVEDLQLAKCPASDLVLYRGSNWETRANWSWTSTFSTAEIYRQKHGGANGLVWVALVPAKNVLARNRRFVQSDGLADEYVVDTMRLDKPGYTIPIRPLDLPPRRAHWPHCRTGQIAVMSKGHRCHACGALVDGRSVGRPFETTRDAFFGRQPQGMCAR